MGAEAKSREKRGKREANARRARRATCVRGEHLKKIPLVRIALFKLFCTCTQLGLRARVIFASVRQNIRKKLLVFGKLVISTTTAHVETATKFDTVVKVKLAGFQW